MVFEQFLKEHGSNPDKNLKNKLNTKDVMVKIVRGGFWTVFERTWKWSREEPKK